MLSIGMGNITTNGSRIRGSLTSDELIIDADDLINYRINLRGGYDTLTLNSENGLSFDRGSYWRLNGVDEIDVSNISGGPIEMTLPKNLLRRSDNDEVTITSGEAGIQSLAADPQGYGTYFVAGEGTVQLADGVSNTVTIADGSTVQVLGGDGDDTITASSDGSLLYGGSGDDQFILQNGADVIELTDDQGTDTAVGFDFANDTIDISETALHSFEDILAATIEDGNGNLSIDFGNGTELVLENTDIEDLSAENFTLEGVALTDATYVIQPGTSAAELNALIEAAPEGANFILKDGVHSFSESIVIDRGDISITGESEANTIIRFDFPDGEVTNGLVVTGGTKTYLDTVDHDIAVGDTTVTVIDHGLQAGDTIYMFQPNTREWLDENGWQNVSMDDADNRPFREVILEVASVNGDAITFTHPIPYAMDANVTRLNTIELFSDITLSDFTVTTPLGVADNYSFTNTEPDYERTTAVNIVGTIGAVVENISVLDSGSTALAFGSSIDLLADDIYVSGSHNKGGGGNGYGILLFETNNSTLTNLEVYDTRHGFITSAWSAETDNTVHILDTNRDVGFHGSPDRGNSVQVDNSVLDFDVPFYGNGGSGWTTVSGSGSNHASIDPFLENQITFANAEGVNRNDIIVADDSGVYMNGKYGYDTLIGGDGDDYLVGGTLADTLTGGEGQDTFLLKVGDGLDTITDFQAGLGGDLMIIANNPDMTSFEDLYFYERDGELRVRFGANATAILEGVSLENLTADNFAFDPDGTLTAENYYGSDFEVGV